MRTLPLAALALFLAGCGGETDVSESSSPPPSPSSSGNRPTLGPLPAQPRSARPGQHTDFRKAFTTGKVIDLPGETIHIEAIQVGELELSEDGAVHAGNPLEVHTALPMPVRAPAGTYRVEVSHVLIRAKDGSGQAEQIAASRVRLGKGRAVTWHWAGNFVASAGIGAWFCPAAAEALAQSADSRLARRIEVAANRDALTHGMLSSDEDGGPLDIAWCHTGVGEGSYDLYVGVDEEGTPVELVADYQILVEPEEVIVFIKDPAHEPPGILPFPELEALGITVRRTHGDELTLSGKPMWFEVDAQANRRHPGLGFPEVIALDAEDKEIKLSQGNTGFKLWVAKPPEPDRIARLAVAVRTGFKAL